MSGAVPAGADSSGHPGRHRLIVLSGPSGVGKGSVVAELRKHHPQVWISVSVTTRPPRPGERDGQDYYFLDEARYAAMVRAGELLEHARYAGHGYGTPRAPVAEVLDSGRPVLLEIDLQGARQVRAAVPEALLVFLAPPSWSALEHRLTARGTEDPAELAERLAKARAELAARAEFDVEVVNDTVPAAAARLAALVTSPGSPGSPGSLGSLGSLGTPGDDPPAGVGQVQC